MKNKLNKMKTCIIFAANRSDRIVSAVTYMKLRSVTEFQASKHVYVPNKEETDELHCSSFHGHVLNLN